MPKNIFISEENKPVQEPEPKPKPEKEKKIKSSSGSFLGKILRKNLSDDLVFRNLPFIFFISFLIFLYIMITNNTETMLGRIESIKNEMKALRITKIHFENVFSSVKKQTSIAHSLDSLKQVSKKPRYNPNS